MPECAEDIKLKLNFRLITDLLSVPVECIRCNSYNGMELSDIYPFIPGRSCDSPEIIYLAEWEELKNAGELPRNLVCIGGGDEALAFFEEHNLFGLIFNDGSKALTILRDIQEVITRYNSMERYLLDSILADEPIRAVLNAVASFFECHISLFSADFTLLEYSDIFQPPEDNIPWNQTRDTKRSVLPIVPRNKTQLMPNGRKDSPSCTLLYATDKTPCHISTGFDFGNSRVVTMAICELNRPLGAHHLWLVDYITDILYPMIMERYSPSLEIRNSFRSSISTALRYSATDSTLLHANLARLGWNINDDYQIILVKLPPEYRKVSLTLYNYENVFTNSFSNSMALRHEGFIVLLLHDSACSELGKYISTLNNQLEIDNGICSIGMKFCDFNQLKIQYDLAKLPLGIATKSHRIRSYGEYMETHLVNELSSCLPLRAICHSAAVRVQSYDTANGTDYLQTLETYLAENKSILTASEKLFIHRGTLAYRLKCIEKIAPMDLDSPFERLHILLSCIALRILNKNGPASKTSSDVLGGSKSKKYGRKAGVKERL
jgi:hypothetical protein